MNNTADQARWFHPTPTSIASRPQASALPSDNTGVPNCANCGAPMRMDRTHGLFVCHHCGSQREAPMAIAHLEVVGNSAHRCPACARPLLTSRLDGYPLLSCGCCFGVLIEMPLFVPVIEAARAREARVVDVLPARRQQPADRTIPCPMCAQPMLAHVYAGPGNVVIDTCERCRVNWLDPGELRRIAVAPDSRHRRRDVADAVPGLLAHDTGD